jgi:hypothetical protein
MRFRKLRRGRCSSCDFEHRQMNNGWGLTALFVDLGSWSQPIKTNCRLAPSGARPEGWSLLLAAASDRASIGGLPKGSGQRSRATTTIIIFGPPLTLPQKSVTPFTPFTLEEEGWLETQWVAVFRFNPVNADVIR